MAQGRSHWHAHLGTRGLSAAAWLYLKIAITGNSAKNVRYVLIDEVQDYTETQLLVLARYFSQAHFMLLGDEFQAIREGTASFPQIRNVFAADGKREVEEVELLTSYRSSPEITDLFASLLPQDKQGLSYLGSSFRYCALLSLCLLMAL